MTLRSTLSIVAVAGVLMAGCATKAPDPVLATVGTKKITLASYREAYAALVNDPPDITNPEARRALLQDLINKQLLENEAYTRNPELDEGQRRRLHRFAEGQLLSLLTKKEVHDKIKVTDSEVRKTWERLDRELKVRHILVASASEASEVAAMISAEKPFEVVAAEKSIDPTNNKQGGDLGWVRAGQMVEEFDDALFKLKPGQVSKPVQTSFGWHIIKVEEERPLERGSFEADQESVRNEITQKRLMAAQEQFQRGVVADARPENQQEAISLIDRKFYVEVPPGKEDDPYFKFSQQRSLPSFTAEELAMPVVLFANREPMTIREFTEHLGWMPPGVWPRGNGQFEVEETIRQILRTRLFKQRALELGIEKSPEFVAQVKKKENEMRVNNLYYKGIVEKINPGEAELRSFFEKFRENYRILERSKQARVVTVDSTVAAEASRMWRSGRSFEEVAAFVAARDPRSATTALSPEIPRGGEPEMDGFVFGGQIGDIVGPVFLPESTSESGTAPARWIVARILDRWPERFMTFDEAKTMIVDHAKAHYSEEELKKLLSDLQQKYPVVINEEALNALTPEDIMASARTTT
jgi:peptidyl-prolyl cis-trans isomerase C